MTSKIVKKKSNYEWLFDQRKKALFKLPYCHSNERDVKHFINKIESFTNEKLKFIVLWFARNIKSLFPLKDRVKQLSCVIYEGKCSCGRCYIGEIIRNNDICLNEHESTTGNSEPAKHFTNKKSHIFWYLHLHIFVKEKSLKRFSLQN